MKRADWQKVKAQAAKFNNGQEIKFPKDMGFGPKLDAYHAAVKKRVGTDIGKDKKAWAIAAQQWLDARDKVLVAAGTYDTELDKLKVNEQAKQVMKKAIFAFLAPLSNGPGPEAAKAAKAGIDRVKKELAAKK